MNLKKYFLLLSLLLASTFTQAQLTTDSLYFLPNPICNQLTIHYNLTSTDTVSLNVFDISGKIVHAFFSNKLQGAAFYTILYNADSLKSGLYMLRFDYGINHSKIKKFVKECDANFIDTVTVVNKLNVYPNPVQSQFIIETSGTAIQQIEIADLNGKVLERINSEIQNETMTINLSKMLSGFYFISIQMSDGKVQVQKFFKE